MLPMFSPSQWVLLPTASRTHRPSSPRQLPESFVLTLTTHSEPQRDKRRNNAHSLTCANLRLYSRCVIVTSYKPLGQCSFQIEEERRFLFMGTNSSGNPPRLPAATALYEIIIERTDLYKRLIALMPSIPQSTGFLY